jgi:hypothetical protein
MRRIQFFKMANKMQESCQCATGAEFMEFQTSFHAPKATTSLKQHFPSIYQYIVGANNYITTTNELPSSTL